jgi:hypothetical protein
MKLKYIASLLSLALGAALAPTVAVLATILLPASIVLAGTESYEAKSTSPLPEAPWCETPPPVEFRIGIPGWIAGLSGDFGVRGVVTEQDVKFTDILQRLDMIAVGSLYARYQRWEIFADGLYMKISDTATLPGLLFDTAHVSLKSAFAEAFVGYRLLNCKNGILSVFAGARYNYMSADLQIANDSDPRFPILRERLGIPPNLKVSGSIDWVDPVIGVSGKVKVAKPVALYAKGDIGGFGAASDFTWQVQGGVEFQVTRCLYSDVGWRNKKNDNTSGGLTNKNELNGPVIETGINF